MKWFKRKIPPPLDVPPQEPIELLVPFAIADVPRVFLDFLARSSKIDEDVRSIIASFVLGVNEELVNYLMENYGEYGVILADEMAKHCAKSFRTAVNEGYKEYEADLLRHLEEDFKDE